LISKHLMCLAKHFFQHSTLTTHLQTHTSKSTRLVSVTNDRRQRKVERGLWTEDRRQSTHDPLQSETK